jgi:uncharacterized protein (TIGR02147 family)
MNQSIFNFGDYKEFVNSWIDIQNASSAEDKVSYRKVALHLNISSTMISQIFKGDKQLSLEMAYELCAFLNLSGNEIDYFLALVELQKAGSYKLKKYYEEKLKAMQDYHKIMEARLKSDILLDEEKKQVFYSNWIFSAVRMLSGIQGYNDIQSLATRLQVSEETMTKVVSFLLENSLCIKKDSKIIQGPAKTFIGSSSSLTQRHHQNWRLPGLQKIYPNNNENLFYTSPMSVSKQVAEQIRKELPNFIDKINKMVLASESEVVRCINIDWFEF